MCRAHKCRQCSKVTWSGCGMHVDEVLAGIPSSARCAGNHAEPGPSLLSRLLGRLIPA